MKLYHTSHPKTVGHVPLPGTEMPGHSPSYRLCGAGRLIDYECQPRVVAYLFQDTRIRTEMTPHRLQHISHPLLLTLAILAFTVQSAMSQRRVTPVNTPATATQPVNEFKNDTARINAAKRASPCTLLTMSMGMSCLSTPSQAKSGSTLRPSNQRSQRCNILSWSLLR